MSSGRLGNDGEPIINANNITKETKTYREYKSKKVGLHLRLTQTISPDSGKFHLLRIKRNGNLAHAIVADFKKITYASIYFYKLFVINTLKFLLQHKLLNFKQLPNVVDQRGFLKLFKLIQIIQLKQNKPSHKKKNDH